MPIVSMESGKGISPTRICPRCGAAFVCGMDEGTAPCWCTSLPPLRVTTPEAGCYCRGCLSLLVQAQEDKADGS